MVHKDVFDLLFPGESSLKNYLEEDTAKDWVAAIEKNLVEVNYKKGALLLSFGHVPNEIFILQTGSIRGYFYSDAGKDRTLYLWEGLSLVTDMINFNDDRPSDLYIEVARDATVLTLSKLHLEEVMHRFPESQAFARGLTQLYARHHRGRDKDYTDLNGEKRLIKFTDQSKGIMQMFSMGHIASYLGVSKAWLFRINKKKRR